ncbi:unnamed protein product [Hydatigera taeniaeformis]|uniref:Ribosomal RNA-processing protein 14/surfeit locus protein 6 C-terminal domain-containing protein n=1 Tax=Hydatigena taeniaeformis TaxID=6205 RepID=A0A3P7FWT4_HYDTA|nr:unnamed protein product [Hydatigera taeniaeformis]
MYSQGSDYYFSKIETFDRDELANSVSSRKKRRKEERRTRRLENLGIFIGKSSGKMLAKARRYSEYVSKLKSEDQEKSLDQAIIGIKVKTDLSKMQRSALRARKLKRKSSNRWKERNQKIQEERDVRQRKRQRNLQRRSDAKASKKYGRLVKKGHILPQLPKE